MLYFFSHFSIIWAAHLRQRQHWLWQLYCPKHLTSNLCNFSQIFMHHSAPQTSSLTPPSIQSTFLLPMLPLIIILLAHLADLLRDCCKPYYLRAPAAIAVTAISTINTHTHNCNNKLPSELYTKKNKQKYSK